jgi:AcrR family transcriptional regulator
MIETKRLTPISDCDVRDPRMKRTRQLLQGALRKLLRKKSLDEILVQDITDAATINRATFYDHYVDKFALFQAMIASDFHKLLQERNVRFSGSCSAELTAMILAVCDYLQQIHNNQTDCARHEPFAPLMDAAITLAIRRILLDGLSKHREKLIVEPEIIASTTSSAIYAAANEWFRAANRRPAEEAVPSLVRLILPLLEGSATSRQSVHGAEPRP